MKNFNPNHVLEDSDIIADGHFLDIEKFFVLHKSPLAGMKINKKYVSSIINDLCAEYKVNPKIVLLTLQKEQSLISGNPIPSQHALDWALGYGMANKGHKGLLNQLYNGISWWRQGYENSKNLFVPATINFKTEEKITVHPENVATQLCYIYTPYLGTHDFEGNITPFGNYLLHICNRKYFYGE